MTIVVECCLGYTDKACGVKVQLVVVVVLRAPLLSMLVIVFIYSLQDERSSSLSKSGASFVRTRSYRAVW